MPTIASSTDENSLLEMAASRLSRMFSSSSSKRERRNRNGDRDNGARDSRVESFGAPRYPLDHCELPEYNRETNVLTGTPLTGKTNTTSVVEAIRRNFLDAPENKTEARQTDWEKLFLRKNSSSLTERSCESSRFPFPRSLRFNKEAIYEDGCNDERKVEEYNIRQHEVVVGDADKYLQMLRTCRATEGNDAADTPYDWLTEKWNWRLTAATTSTFNNTRPQLTSYDNQSMEYTAAVNGVTSGEDDSERTVEEDDEQFRVKSTRFVEIAANATLYELRKLQLTTLSGNRHLSAFRIVAPSLREEPAGENIREASISKTIEQLSFLFALENVKCISVCCGKILTLADIRVIVKYFRNLESFHVSMCKIEPFALMKNMLLLPRLIALDIYEEPDAWKHFTPKSAVTFAARVEKIMSSFGGAVAPCARAQLKALRWSGSSGNDYQHMQLLKHLASYHVLDGLISLSVSPAPFVFFRNIKLPSLERLIVSDDDCGKNTYSGSYGESATSVKYLWITIGEHCPSVSGFESFLLNFRNVEKIRITASTECTSLCTNNGQILYSLRLCKNLKEFHFEDMTWCDEKKHRIRENAPSALWFALRGIPRNSKVTIDVVFVNKSIASTTVKEIGEAINSRQRVNLRILPIVNAKECSLPLNIRMTPYAPPQRI